MEFSRRWRRCCCCDGSDTSERSRATIIGVQLAGSRINFNRRDPSNICNALFASSNNSSLVDKSNWSWCKSRANNASQVRLEGSLCNMLKHLKNVFPRNFRGKYLQRNFRENSRSNFLANYIYFRLKSITRSNF